MIEAAEQALANFQHEQGMAQAHQRRADGYLAQFLSLVGQKAGDGPTGQTIRCVREWTRWLADNGPALKSDITEATGIKFTERGTPHTFLWDDSMDPEDDGAYPAMALMRMQGPKQDGAGRPPMVYFLWSQRWDVHPRFGVGPTETQPPVPQAEWADEPTALTGVVRPPVSAHPIDPAHGEEVPINWDEWEAEVVADSGEREAALSEPDLDAEIAAELSKPRCSTIEEWDDLHAAYFDAMVASERKPTDDEKAELRETLPAGAEPNAALAMAYRAAVERARGKA